MLTPRHIRSLARYHRDHDRQVARHDYADVFEKTTRDLARVGLGAWSGKQVLDVGCGQRLPFSLIAASRGAQVTALDAEYVDPRHPFGALLPTAQAGGLTRALMTFTRQMLFDRAYFRTLFDISGADWSATERIRFRRLDVTTGVYPLQSDSFDVAASNAVAEHIADLPGFLGEVARVLRPGGLFHCLIHNYYSLSGGHNLDWAYPDESPPAHVPPWDHLRGNRRPAHLYLNMLRPEEYREAFAAVFDVLMFEPRDAQHDPGGEEGRRFLTPEVREELRDYPEELLLTRAFAVVGRKGC